MSARRSACGSGCGRTSLWCLSAWPMEALLLFFSRHTGGQTSRVSFGRRRQRQRWRLSTKRRCGNTTFAPIGLTHLLWTMMLWRLGMEGMEGMEKMERMEWGRGGERRWEGMLCGWGRSGKREGMKEGKVGEMGGVARRQGQECMARPGMLFLWMRCTMQVIPIMRIRSPSLASDDDDS